MSCVSVLPATPANQHPELGLHSVMPVIHQPCLFSVLLKLKQQFSNLCVIAQSSLTILSLCLSLPPQSSKSTSLILKVCTGVLVTSVIQYISVRHIISRPRHSQQRCHTAVCWRSQINVILSNSNEIISEMCVSVWSTENALRNHDGTIMSAPTETLGDFPLFFSWTAKCRWSHDGWRSLVTPGTYSSLPAFFLFIYVLLVVFLVVVVKQIVCEKCNSKYFKLTKI